jgi:hypothetical protein
VQRCHKPTGRNAARGVTKDASRNSASSPLHLPNVAALIEDGEITIGVLDPVGCVATASDGHNCLAKLVRRKGENLAQLLTRLDLTIAKAYTEDIFTDEIKPPQTNSKRR